MRTLGARRGQVRAVFLSEYVALGTIATLSGVLLAGAAAAVLLPSVFEVLYVPSIGMLGLVWAGVTGLTVLVGLAGTRKLLDRPPLPVLREAGGEA